MEVQEKSFEDLIQMVNSAPRICGFCAMHRVDGREWSVETTLSYQGSQVESIEFPILLPSMGGKEIENDEIHFKLARFRDQLIWRKYEKKTSTLIDVSTPDHWWNVITLMKIAKLGWFGRRHDKLSFKHIEIMVTICNASYAIQQAVWDRICACISMPCLSLSVPYVICRCPARDLGIAFFWCARIFLMMGNILFSIFWKLFIVTLCHTYLLVSKECKSSFFKHTIISSRGYRIAKIECQL